MSGNNNAPQFNGTNNPDTLLGGPANQTIFGAGNTSTLPGSGGGQTDADTIRGDGGNDIIYGGSGNDSLFGDAGNDTIFGGNEGDTITGGAGNDILSGGDGIDLLSYTADNTGVLVNLGTNSVSGGSTLSEAFGDAISGFEAVYAAAGSDTLIGDGNANTLDGGAGGDSLNGGGGLDLLSYRFDAGGVSVDLALNTASDGQAQGDSIAGFEALLGGGNNDTLIGDGIDNTIEGASGGDSMVGGLGNDLLSYQSDNSGVSVNLGTGAASGGHASNDTFSGFEGLLGGRGSDTLIGDGNANTLDGGAGDDSLSGGGGADSLAGGGGNDLVVVGTGGADTADGGANTDTMAFNLDGVVTIAGTAADFTYTLPGGDTGIGRNFESLRDAQGNLVSVSSILGTGGTGTLAVCFAEGTRILTSTGEVAVERLRAGDRVATLSGTAPTKPVLWVGRRRVTLAGNPAADALRPVRIAAGALGEATPHRDLLVSPDHCLYLDGALVPARLLVNGLTVTVERGLSEVAYFHVELEGHDVLLANGAAAESWLDAGNRAWFENAPVALLQVADAPDAYGTPDGATPCAPVVQGGRRLAAIRDAIALRADRLPGDRPAEPPIRIATAG